MAWCGAPPVLKPTEERFSAYVRRLEQFFVVNDLIIPTTSRQQCLWTPSGVLCSSQLWGQINSCCWRT